MVSELLFQGLETLDTGSSPQYTFTQEARENDGFYAEKMAFIDPTP